MSDHSFRSKQVCNYFINKAEKEGITLTPMQAVKLVYFAHAWKLGFTGHPLIQEPVEAWQYGAVIPSLYHALKIYGAGSIQAPIIKDQQKYIVPLLLGETKDIPHGQAIDVDISEEDKQYVDAVWDGYKHLTAIQMSNMIHKAGTPWSEVWNNGRCSRHAIIDNERIEKYYKQKAGRAVSE